MMEEKNSYYVYFWIDSTDEHRPFYIGKGKLKRGESHASIKIDDDKKESDISEKLKKFQEIRSKGSEPYVRRYMWGLSEDNAFAVETALINIHKGLTNISEGRALEKIRRQKDFLSWKVEYPGIDFAPFTKKLEWLDSEDKTTRYFNSKLDAFQKAGSKHERAQGSYFHHTERGIRMWMGDVNDKVWGNTYNKETGEVCIKIEPVLAQYGGSWESVIKHHEEIDTINRELSIKHPKRNYFLCFMRGLLPNNYVQFVGVYRDNWEESKRRGSFVRERVAKKWRITKND